MLPGVKGAFALRDIPKGIQIIEYKGKLISKELANKRADVHRSQGELWIFTLNKDYDIDASRQGNDARFINHSCKPNCEAVNYDDEELWIEATEDIKKGDELTYNYGFTEPDEAYPCLCGHDGCRGWIVAEEYEFAPDEKEKLQELQQELLTELKHLENATHFVIEKRKKGLA